MHRLNPLNRGVDDDDTHDFGGIIRGRPQAVVRPSSLAGISQVLASCRDRGLSVTVRGTGHGSGGRAVAEGGVLLKVDRLGGSLSLEEDGIAEFPASTTWRVLGAALGGVGREVLVHPDYLDIAVGGTIAVGGYGHASVTAGAVFNHVAALRLVLPSGEATWCSPTERTELFELSLAGLGQVGVIERVRLATRERVGPMRVSIDQFETVEALATGVGRVLGDDAPDRFVISIDPETTRGGLRTIAGRVTPHAGPGVVADYDEEVHAALRARIATDPQALRPFVAFGFAPDAWGAFVQDIDSWRRSPVFARRVEAITGYVRRDTIGLSASTPLSPCFGGGPRISMGVYTAVPSGDALAETETRRLLDEIFARGVERGGRPYLAGYAPLNRSMARSLYGEHLDVLSAQRRVLDPTGCFNPGWREVIP